MARSLTGALSTEFQASSLKPILLSEFEFASGTIRFWSGSKSLSWNGSTWTGTGDLLQISSIEETVRSKAAGLQFILSGIPAATISLALNEDYSGRIARLYMGALDSSDAVVADPYLLFLGYMDVMDMSEDGETAMFVLAVENRMVALERPSTQMYTSARQQLDYPNDKGFDQVPALQDIDILWE